MKPFTSKHCTPLHHGSHRISVVKDGVSHKHDGAGNTIDKGIDSPVGILATPNSTLPA